MDLFLTVLLDGLIYASWLFVVALGLTLVFGVLKILNIAHGSLYAIGAYAAASAVGFAAARGFGGAWSLLALLLAAALVALVVAPLLERGLLRLFYGRDEVVLLLVTYALFLILEDVTKLVWGANPYYVTEPYAVFGNVALGPLFYVGYDVALIGLALVCGLAVWFGLNRTVSGKIVLAVIHNREMSAGMGVNIGRVQWIAFTVGVFLAALGGAATAPRISVQPGISVAVIVTSFAVIVIGGLGSIEGAAIGALVVGLASAAAIHLLPEAELFVAYLVMAAVLVFRPEGLFQRAAARKI